MRCGDWKHLSRGRRAVMLLASLKLATWWRRQRVRKRPGCYLSWRGARQRMNRRPMCVMVRERRWFSLNVNLLLVIEGGWRGLLVEIQTKSMVLNVCSAILSFFSFGFLVYTNIGACPPVVLTRFRSALVVSDCLWSDPMLSNWSKSVSDSENVTSRSVSSYIHPLDRSFIYLFIFFPQYIDFVPCVTPKDTLCLRC